MGDHSGISVCIRFLYAFWSLAEPSRGQQDLGHSDGDSLYGAWSKARPLVPKKQGWFKIFHPALALNGDDLIWEIKNDPSKARAIV